LIDFILLIQPLAFTGKIIRTENKSVP